MLKKIIATGSLGVCVLFGAGCATTQPTQPLTTVPKTQCLEFTDLSLAFKGAESVCVLNVSGKGLTGALPAEIRQFSAIQRLDASKNKLTGIPAEIGQLSTAREIDFSANNIDTMPNEIEKLTHLESLSLAKNAYRTVPDVLLKMTWLRLLDLTGNPLPTSEVVRVRNALPTTQILF